MLRPLSGRAAALLIAAAMVVAACGDAPSPAPSSAPPRTFAPTEAPTVEPSGTPNAAIDAVFDEIEAQVLELRGLPAVDVERVVLSEEELAERSKADFEKDNPAEWVAAVERTYKAMGLLDEDVTMSDLYLDLIGSQVAGFYRPDEKTLYVVSRSGGINGADKITFAHEYTHALQDGAFDIFDDPEQWRDKTDQAYGRAALYEGDATLLMTLWAIPNLTQEELQEVVAAGNDPVANEILAQTPAILKEPLLFPYTTGQAFLLPMQQSGGFAAIDEVFASPPLSTEQVMHPDKYAANEQPIAVTIPADLAGELGDGWSVALEDTWGEFQTGIWLRELGVPPGAANTAAAGWGGDRQALLTGPGGAWVLVMRSEWDTAGDATEFEEAATTAVAEGPYPGEVRTDDDVITVVWGSDESILEAATGALGA